MSSDDIERPKLGEYLKSHRELQGKTQRGLGGTALSASYLTQIENDIIHDPKLSTLFKLAKAYDVSISAILSDVYGYRTETDQVDEQALAIGETVLALPEDRRKLTIEWIEYQSRITQEQSAQKPEVHSL